MIKHLKGLEINTIYDFDNAFSINELLCKFWEKIEETINISNESIDILNWIKEQALTKEVETLITKLVEDGTIEQMINIDKIEELKNNLENRIGQLETNTTNEIDLINNKLDTIEVTLSNDVVNFKEEVTERVDDLETALENSFDTLTMEYDNKFNNLESNLNDKLSSIKYVKTQAELKDSLIENSIIYICNDISLNEIMYLPSNCRIIGKGNVTLTTNQNAIFVTGKLNVTAYNGTKNVIIDGITFDGQNEDTAPLTIIGLAHAQNITITNCTFKNLHIWHMIEINASKNIIVNNCRFENYGLSGTQCTEAIQIDAMTDSTVFPWGGSYDNTPCDNITIENCVFENIGKPSEAGNGVVKAIGNHTFKQGVLHDKIKIIGNKFENVGWAIYLRDCVNVMINNNISKNTHCFFRTETVENNLSDFIITNNHHIGIASTTFDNQIDGRFIMIQHQGNRDSYKVRNISIDNNNIYNVTGHAIGITANYVKISNNYIFNYGRNGIYLYGGDINTIYGNTIAAAPNQGYFGIKVGGNANNSTNSVVVSNNVSSIKVDGNSTQILVTGNIGNIDNTGSATLSNNL